MGKLKLISSDNFSLEAPPEIKTRTGADLNMGQTYTIGAKFFI